MVEPTSVADVAAVGVLPPQRRLGGQAVGTEDPATPAPLRVETDRQSVFHRKMIGNAEQLSKMKQLMGNPPKKHSRLRVLNTS